MTRRRPASSTYRSKYEKRVAERAFLDGIELTYEPVKIGYYAPVHRGKCSSCGSTGTATRPATYTPDWGLTNGTYVETKGKFTSANRTRALAFKLARPDITVRMLFMADNWLTKRHKQRYSDWCRANGFDYAIGERIPLEWTK